jgi:iron-sulfur cluster assembly protein
MSIVLTEKAANEVRRAMDEMKAEDGSMLRVSVTGGGCSGFQYSLTFDNAYDENADTKLDFHGVPVVVDRKSALYLEGAELDYIDGIEQRGFTFRNPNAVKSCGCGQSFQA